VCVLCVCVLVFVLVCTGVSAWLLCSGGCVVCASVCWCECVLLCADVLEYWCGCVGARLCIWWRW